MAGFCCCTQRRRQKIRGGRGLDRAGATSSVQSAPARTARHPGSGVFGDKRTARPGVLRRNGQRLLCRTLRRRISHGSIFQSPTPSPMEEAHTQFLIFGRHNVHSCNNPIDAMPHPVPAPFTCLSAASQLLFACTVAAPAPRTGSWNVPWIFGSGPHSAWEGNPR